MSALLELATRVEAATGPDREMDYWIMTATVVPGHAYLWDPADNSHRYTASLDAAMSLVPEGWVVGEMSWWPDSRLSTCHMDNRKRLTACSGAVALPLALCAASLRARAALETGDAS